MSWTTPDPARFAPDDVLEAADLNNFEGNFEHIVTDTVQIQDATSDLTLTNSYQDVPGMSITLLKSGKYSIRLYVFFIGDGTGGDSSQELFARLVVNGVPQPGEAISEVGTTTTTQHFAGREWIITASSSGLIAKIQGKKGGGSGTSSIRTVVSHFVADWKSP